MSKALELRQKRADLWEKAKLFLDNAKRDGDVMSAEDTATYENMEKEDEEKVISYTDITGLLMSSVSTIVDLRCQNLHQTRLQIHLQNLMQEKQAERQTNTKMRSGLL